EHLVERDEERDRTHVHVGEERIPEVDLRQRGVGVPALDVGFPQQQEQHTEADEHRDDLEERGRPALHGPAKLRAFVSFVNKYLSLYDIEQHHAGVPARTASIWVRTMRMPSSIPIASTCSMPASESKEVRIAITAPRSRASMVMTMAV